MVTIVIAIVLIDIWSYSRPVAFKEAMDYKVYLPLGCVEMHQFLLYTFPCRARHQAVPVLFIVLSSFLR